jgi:ABC-2 type transport system ATP-binding protein
MNPEDPIRMQQVNRSYDGPPVLHDLNLSVPSSSIYGFLGRNGAGKTTALRMLAGMIKPHSGEVRVLGADPFTIGAGERQWIGYMSEKPMLPGMTRVKSVIALGRSLYPTWDTALAESLLSRYELGPRMRYSELSQGRQRLLAFVMAIAPRPKVLLLDEPAANLDVVARREILDDILDLIRDCECTVLFSTHILSDVERVADEIGILANGSLRVSESLDSLKTSIRQMRCFGFRNGIPREDLPGSFRSTRGREEVIVTIRTNPELTPERIAQRWSCECESRALNLEDIFVELSLNQP